MNGLNDSIVRFTKQYVTCSCGEKCHMSMYVCEHFITISARCGNCDKGMSLTENVGMIECAGFDLVDHLIEEFEKRFNREAKNDRTKTYRAF